MRKGIVVGLICSYTLGMVPVGLAWASPPPTADVVFAHSSQGPWSPQSGPDTPWVRCQSPQGSVVPLSDRVLARMAPGTQLEVHHSAEKCSVSHVQGRVFVRVASAPISMDLGNASLSATTGEFQVDASSQGLGDLKVLSSGDVVVTPHKPILIAGTDTRTRAIRRDKFKRDQTKGLGRTKPKPTIQVPPPPVTVAPPPPTTPPPPPPPTTPPPPYGPTAPDASVLADAGSSLGGLFGALGGALALGGLIFAISNNTNSSNNPNTPINPFVVKPASP